MLQRRWIYSLAIIALLLPTVASRLVHAEEAGMIIAIEPEVAPPGTTVTISGYGAPAHARVVVLYAPWAAPLRCQDGRDAAKVAEVTADGQGYFSAAYVAHQLGADQVGYTFLAKVTTSDSETPELVSNITCFTFSQRQRVADDMMAPDGGMLSPPGNFDQLLADVMDALRSGVQPRISSETD